MQDTFPLQEQHLDVVPQSVANDGEHCVCSRRPHVQGARRPGTGQRFVADSQCPECKKCFVTRAREVQHGHNTKCKHAMVSEECAKNAPEEQVRLDHEMATFRRNAQHGS